MEQLALYESVNLRPIRISVIDLETLGTKPGCGILQFGMVTFDFDVTNLNYTTVAEHEIKAGYDLASEGGDVDAKTMKFWSLQPDETREMVFGGKDIEDYFDLFRRSNKTIVDMNPDYLFCKGNDFDFSILEYGWDRFIAYPLPYHFSQKHDMRALLQLFPNCYVEPEIPHVALCDAQAEALSLYNVLALIYEKTGNALRPNTRRRS